MGLIDFVFYCIVSMCSWENPLYFIIFFATVGANPIVFLYVYCSWGKICGTKDIPSVYTDVYSMLQQHSNYWLCNALGIKKPDCPAFKASQG